jgi:amino acid adenylation domain-containing protein/non-ribosomal peptide synthase protein (TIGR01720 family)
VQELLDSVKALSSKERKALAILLKRQGINLYGVAPISPREPGEPLVLSYAQQRQWFLWQLEPDGTAYNMPTALRLKGALDVDALRASFDALIARHETLRTTFHHQDGLAVQVVHPPVPLVLVAEPVALPAGDIDGALAALVEAETQHVFNLEHGPLLRAKLLRLGEDDHVLVLIQHHIVSDGWSMPIMVDELVRGYEGFCRAQPVQLPALPIQYADYAIWQRQWMEAGEQERQLAYWTAHLGTEHPVLELPIDRPRPAHQSYAGAILDIELDATLAQALKQLAQRQGVTLFTLLLASFQTLLHRYSGQDDIRVGVPVANRNRVETEGLIGFFVNTQVFKAQFDLSMTFEALLKQVHRHALDAQAHQDLPFEQLVEALQVPRSLSHTPLFQVMYSHQAGERGASQRVSGLVVEGLSWERTTAQFDLTLNTFEFEHGIGASLGYATALFDTRTVKALAGHWLTLLHGIVQTPGHTIAQLPLLDSAQHEQIVGAWNRTPAQYPSEQCIHQVIEGHAAHTPDRIAVVCEDGQLTYQQLNWQANRLAQRLRDAGTGPDVLVGIAVTRSLEMVVGLLAILKAGGAYVPLDPEYPQDRLAYMMADSGIALLLTQSPLVAQLPIPQGVRTLLIDQPDDCPPDWPAGNLENLTHPHHLAYVIYTSGSTGKPKGTLLPHHNVTRLFSATAAWYRFDEHDVWSVFHSYAFDFSVWELFGALLHGAKAVLVPKDTARSTDDLLALLAKEKVTVLNQTPSAFKQLVRAATSPASDYPPLSLRYVIFGGEALDVGSLRPWFDAFGDARPQLINMYGITETTVHVTYRPISREDLHQHAISPIGVAIDDLSVYVLDADFNVAVPGCQGELHVGRAGLARGYHQRAALTAERFVPDPFDTSEQGGGRLYRTGDLVRGRREGAIDYVGRIDHQVKIRGFRIELGEIEARLQEHEAVQEARALDVQGPHGKQLVAYLVAATERSDDVRQGTLRQQLREHLNARLPDYMVPAHVLFVAQMPLTSNGKLDRKALPAPDADQQRQAYVAPRSELERQIAEVWADVLKVEKVGLEENFFELGGDSIISIQVVSRARQSGIRFTPKQLFEHQTVQGLATVASLASDDDLQLDQTALTGEGPLLPIQRWFFETDIPQRHHWNQAVLLRPGGVLQPEPLEAALAALLEHHDALRLSFAQDPEGTWTAHYRPFAPLPSLLWRSDVRDDAELNALCSEAQASLDLQQGSVVRAVLATLADGSQRLLLAIHHLVVDGVSWRILLEDLQLAYEQSARKASIVLAPKTSSTRAWVEHLQAYANSAALEDELSLWQSQLAVAHADLPCDYPQGSLQGHHASEVQTRLDQSCTQQLLKQAPTAYRTQINDLLLTALVRVIARWTGHDDVLVQLEGHGREELFDDIDLTRTVGWFTSVFPVRLTSAATLPAAIKGIKEQLRAIPHKGLGFGALRYLGRKQVQDSLRQLAVPRITFNYLGQFDSSFAGHDNQSAFWVPAQESSGPGQSAEAALDNWLSINGQVYGGELSLSWTFSRDMFDPGTIQRLAHEYAQELKALIAHCISEEAAGLTPSDVPLARITQAQLDALVIASGQVEDIYPLSPMQQGMLFHTLYEQDGGSYINQLRIDVEGLDIERFRQAWQQVVDRHEVLRANFVTQFGQPLQVVRKHLQMPFDVLDWSAHGATQPELDALAQADRRKGFDLQHDPLLRITAIKCAAHSYHLVYTNHHILMDGWSNSQLLGEVLQAYAGEPLAPQTSRYRDYIEWLQRQDERQARAFWQHQLNDFDTPTRLVQTLRQDPQSLVAGHSEYGQALDEQATRRISEFARSQRVTVNTLVQAAWLLLLQRYTGQACVAFGATVAGRPTELKGVERQLGLFINTLPVIACPEPHHTVAEWIAQIQAQNVALREYEHTPLFDIQRWAARVGEGLFDTILVFENYPVSEALQQASSSGLTFMGTQAHEQTHYPLTLAIGLGAQLSIEYSYDTSALNDQTVHRIAGHFVNLLQGLIKDTQRCIGALPLLDASETRSLVAQWDNSHSGYRSDRAVHQLFADQAERTPDAVAVLFDDQQLTYRQLDTQANRLAHRLIASGVGPEVRVAIAMRRSADIMVAFLAVLKAGGAYVPLDVAYPAQRLRYMMDDCAAALVLTQSDLLGTLAIPEGLATLLVDQHADWVDCPAGAPVVALTEDNLAYVIYTSGSTGLPKGVAVAHGPLVAHIRATGERYETGAADCELHFMSFAFDGAHEGWMHPLINGARVLIRDDSLWLPEQTYAQMHRHGVTIGVFPPLYLLQLAEHVRRVGNPPATRIYCFGGDAVPQASYALAWQALRPQYLFNGYGPTETVVTPLLWKAGPGDPCGAAYAPIGSLLGRRRGYLLDSSLNVLPTGFAAELYLGGHGVARGYLDRPAQTAERFVPDAFGDGERVYRSGDLTRLRDDGLVDYLGRVDHQVKVRGYRIELGEIEARLQQHAAVSESVVIDIDGPGGKQLVAYVIASDHEEQQDRLRAQLREHLHAQLPDYMIPAHLLFLTAMPLTPNGKLDRKALPRPAAIERAHEYVAPHSELERAMAAIWAQVLDVDKVGLTDNFFELGGDSILCMQVIAQARSLGPWGATLSLRDLMHKATLRELLGANTQGGCLVPLNEQRQGAPMLFCIHGGFGTVFDYRRLAGELQSRWSVVGVQSRMLLEPDWLDESLEAMAKEYAAQIRLRQPQGPYHLLGWSLGGTLSVLVSHELETQGEQVAFLGLVDSFVRPAADDPREHWQDDLAALVDSLTLTREAGEGPALADCVSELAQTAPNILQVTRQLMNGRTLRLALAAEDLANGFRVERHMGRLVSVFRGVPHVRVSPVTWWVEGRREDSRTLAVQMGKEPLAQHFIASSHYQILQEEDFIRAIEARLGGQ